MRRERVVIQTLWPEAERIVRDDGFVDFADSPDLSAPSPPLWHSMMGEGNCCCYCERELKVVGSQLAGQRISTEYDEGRIISIDIFDNDPLEEGLSHGWVRFLAVNRLTDTTAFGLLHYLLHYWESA